MPNSLKCKIKHLCHNRTITERDRDRILKALEYESVLDKIRAEIMSKDGLEEAIEIIDKYKAESEVQNERYTLS